jgi:hypothetical protein
MAHRAAARPQREAIGPDEQRATVTDAVVAVERLR